jgi:exosortase B
MMSAGHLDRPGAADAAASQGSSKVDWVSVGAIGLGFLALLGPTFIELAQTVWVTDEQGHGPIILAISWWLLYSRRKNILAAPISPCPGWGWSIFTFGVLLYAVGRSQHVLGFQAATQIILLIAVLLLFRGTAALKAAWFPLFFLIFMIPLPEALVAAVTAPLKTAVSTAASGLLYALGYPIGRSGVMLTIGQYQLLVADACAGLNSMFTLEALGMLYMNLMNYTSVARNVALATILIPVSFCANVVRVMILVLVTYYFGDEAGQGFVHGFAGMVLFVVALCLMLVIDRVLGFFLPAART